ESPLPVPRMQSVFHPLAQRTAFRPRGERQQSRPFALRDQSRRNNSLASSNWRLISSHGNDLARGEVVEIPWICRVVARIVGIGIVVQHCVQAKIVEIRERKRWASVKEMVGRKV